MSGQHELLSKWVSVDGGILGSANLRRELKLSGINKAGWRLYEFYGDVLFKPFGFAFRPNCHDLTKEDAIAWLLLLQGCNLCVPPPAGLVSSMDKWKIPHNSIANIPTSFFLAVLKQYALAECTYNDPDLIDAYVREELVPLAVWYFSSGIFKDDINLQKAAGNKPGYKKLQEYRKNDYLQKAQLLGGDTWPPIVRSIEVLGVRMEALTSYGALKKESVIIGKSIQYFGNEFVTSSLRAYSLEYVSTKARLATILVREMYPGDWFVVSNERRNGGDLDDEKVEIACDVLIMELNKVSRVDDAIRKFLDGLPFDKL